MTIGPIDWGAHDPDLVERVLAVMLLQERPHAWRRERSRGDGGVDVADPVVGGYEVFQIKSFTGTLTSRRKSDIRNSFNSALAGGELDRPIALWRLFIPMDPSKEAEKWFYGLTDGAPFKCEWWGKSRVELLATRNPHVIDYYLRDGRSRVEQRYRDLLRMRDLIESSDHGPGPAEITEGLRLLLEALNRDDPHYRYAFEVSHDVPPVEGELARPGVVMARTECADNGCVTIRVFARHRHALEERPVTISFNVQAGSDAEAQLQRALDFGSTASLPQGTVSNLAVSAPGGLTASADDAWMRVLASGEQGFVPFRLIFAVVDDGGEEIGRTAVVVTERRAGRLGKELVCVEADGAFSLQLRITDPSTDDFAVSMSPWNLDFWGKPAIKVKDGVNLLAHLHMPNSLVVSLEAGERHLMTLDCQDVSHMLPSGVTTFVNDLSAVQRCSSTPLLVPMAITAGDVRRVSEAAHLVAGTLIDGVWQGVRVVVHAENIDDFIARVDNEEVVALRVPYRLRVGNQDVLLGESILRLSSARIADVGAAQAATRMAGSSQDGVPITLVPGDVDRFEMLWGEP